MNLKNFVRLLSSQDIVEKLANSYFIRRLAQLTHYSYIKASQAGQKSIDKYAHQQETKAGTQDSSFMFSRVLRRFFENIQIEIEKNNKK